jgi:diacylglycerol kinase family enzyme
VARNIAVLLNARAGAVLDAGADNLREAICDGLQQSGHLDIQALAPREMLAAIARIPQSEYELIVIGGGDGSVNAAAQVMAGTDKTLGVLPFGTLNLLARDLGVPEKPRDAMAALARSETQTIDLATINGRFFHSMSGAGFFSQMARARQELRSVPGKVLRMASAALRAFSRTGRFAVSVEADGCRTSVDCYALMVTCNAFTGDGWHRPSLQQGVLEVHIAKDRNVLDRFAAASALLTGGWRDHPSIMSFTAKALKVGSARRRVWVSTDGELARETVPLAYAIRPRALKVLKPKVRDSS